MERFGQKTRSIACSLGLLTTAAVMVHISGGLIEMHFSFFVIILLLTLYEEWLVFLVAVAYVLLHHGVLGTIDPRAVFNRTEQFNEPWKWAAIHAAFVAAAGLAGIIAWRLNEQVRGRMREAQRGLEIASLTDGLTGTGAARPQRVQGLQRRLRPFRRRCPAHPPRPPAARRGGPAR